MPTPVKQQTIEELNDLFTRAKAGVLANYQGIPAVQLTQMRAHMKQRSLDFRVVKNTLARRAAQNTAFEPLASSFKGPVSLLVGFDDVVAPAKALSEYAKSGVEKKPEVLCGVVEGQLIGPEDVQALAELPSKEALISQMLSVFQGPTTNFAGVFHSLLRNLVGTLDAIREKKAQG